MSERRRSPRVRTILGGVISFNKQLSTLDCSVRNFAPQGARVEFANTAILPDVFDLTITRKQATFRSRIVWRNEAGAGLVFFDPQASEVVSIDWARKLKTLEAQNKALRKRISDLREGGI